MFVEKEMGEDEIFHDMKRCTRCILPETFLGIEFDENGVCNYCLDYEPMKVYGEEAFEAVLSEYRNNGAKYDCLVPISGGRDSSYLHVAALEPILCQKHTEMFKKYKKTDLKKIGLLLYSPDG